MDDEHRRGWFGHALQFIHHPVALVDKNQKFVWVNAAYERLVGYSEAELLGKTWMQITDMTDVGGDLAAVESIVTGDRATYTTAKKYQHKGGETIPVAITVWRFPMAGELVGFSVEAIPEDAMSRIDQIHKLHVAEIAQLKERIASIENFWQTINKVGSFCIKWSPLIGGAVAAAAWVYEMFWVRK